MKTNDDGMMLKIFQWIGKHKFLSLMIILFILVFQPFAVHLFLKIYAPTPFFERAWDAGDLITYIAGFEAFIGTVALGLATIVMNNKANKLSQDSLERDKKRDEHERQPFLALVGSEVFPVLKGENELSSFPRFEPHSMILEYDNDKDKVYGVFLYLKNVSKTFAMVDMNNMHTNSFDQQNEQFDFYRISNHDTQTFLNVLPEKEIKLGFLFEKESLFSHRYLMCTLRLDLFNTVGEKYTEIISFHIESNPQRHIRVEVAKYLIEINKTQDPIT
jgi:hypothetical protein